nr:retrovirus-related Pol polyprotein from transposon TNT 1-94 [Tanacetum cinerariifolium]
MHVVQIILWYLDSGCSKHMTEDRSQLINFVHKFLGTVKFENDHVAKIMGYGDYKIGNVTISRVYFVEGLGHNLFSVGQFCDSDLEVAFHQHTCFIQNLDGVDLLTGSQGNNLYTLSLQDMMASSPILQAESTSSSSSTTIDQDAPSLSKSQTTPETQSSVIPQDVEEYIHDIKVAHIGNDPLFGVPIPKVTSSQSSSTVSPHTIVQSDHQTPQHNSKWTMDHPLDNIIVKPKTYKEALTQSCWIKAMQEELNEFERLEKYGFESCDLVDTPMVEKSKLDEDKEGKAVDLSHYHGMIVTLLYLTASRRDLQFAICMCAWYQARPIEKHIHAVKRIFRYLRGTVNRGLWYPKDSSVALIAFADADHAGCQDTRRSTSGSFKFLGERLISWSSKRQKSAAISTLSSKHVDIRYHFIKEQVENGVIELYFVNTEYQLADLFTKALSRDSIEFLINKLGMRSFTSETLKQLMDEVDE